jgi:hypothetical protein
VERGIFRCIKRKGETVRMSKEKANIGDRQKKVKVLTPHWISHRLSRAERRKRAKAAIRRAKARLSRAERRKRAKAAIRREGQGQLVAPGTATQGTSRGGRTGTATLV